MQKLSIWTAYFLFCAGIVQANATIELTVAGEYVCKNTQSVNILNTEPPTSENVATDFDEKLFTLIGKTVLTRYPAIGDFAVQHRRIRGLWEYTDTQGEYLFTASHADEWAMWDKLAFRKTKSIVTPYTLITMRTVNSEGIKFRFYIYNCVKT